MTATLDSQAARWRQVHEQLSAGRSVTATARALGLDRNTVYRLRDMPDPASYQRADGADLRRLDGLCRRFPNVEFVPDRRRDAEEALTVCTHCPIKAQCAQTALDHGAVGVWGGVWVPISRPELAAGKLRAVVVFEGARARGEVA